MRGAGSTYNDIVDRDIDAQVERTRARPLPSGRVRSRLRSGSSSRKPRRPRRPPQFQRVCIATRAASLAIVAIYPFMKRVTSWPQAVLGFAFAWGALMVWAAAFGRSPWLRSSSMLGAVSWTIGYDTIYALQDVRDDLIVGSDRGPVFGQNVKPAVALCDGACVVFVAWR